MSQEEIRGQTKVFEEAMESAAHEISEDMFGWDFSKMLEELKKTMFTLFPKKFGRSANSIRSFGRNYLGLTGSKFSTLRGWLNGQPMTTDDIRLVLVTLNRIANGTLKTEVKKPIEKIRKEIPEDVQISESNTSGAARKLIDHTITLFNSLVGLIIETGVKSSDVYDGDRMQICDALTRTCKAFGIKAVFPEPDMTRSQPVTREDLRDIGLQTSKRRKSL